MRIPTSTSPIFGSLDLNTQPVRRTEAEEQEGENEGKEKLDFEEYLLMNKEKVRFFGFLRIFDFLRFFQDFLAKGNAENAQ